MWYAIRVTYGRELKFQELLKKAGFETFVPMKRKKIEKNGTKITVIVPAVSNLCFVNTEKSHLENFMKEFGEGCPARFVWDRANARVAVIPEKAMNDFITVCRVMADEALYLKDISEKLRAGRKVRIKEGPFKGVEGVVVRVKKSRRVVVELPGMLAVATTYIQPTDLELL